MPKAGAVVPQVLLADVGDDGVEGHEDLLLLLMNKE